MKSTTASKMGTAKLLIYAEKHGINIPDGTTREQLIALVSTPSTAVESAVALIEENEISTTLVELPIISFEGPSFTFSNGVTVTFSAEGIAYLRQHIKGLTYSGLKDLYREGKWEDIVKIWNDAAPRFNKPYSCHIVNGVCHGVTRNFNKMQHAEVLALVKQASLDQFVVSSGFSWCSFHLDLRIEDLVFLRVENGHSGHISFRQRLVIKDGDYECIFKEGLGKVRSKHLSRLSDGVEKLQSNFALIQDVRLLSLLESTDTEDVILELTPKEYDLWETAKETKMIGTWSKLKMFLTKQGSKGTAKSVLDKVVHYLLEK